MGSRRTMRSSFVNGRSSNGNDISGSSRPSGCSYLSNVRPENRSTLCSMMAQLIEETQPSFEATLKSKAVSENCNVKFACVVTGHPTPQVIWYKDDVQLDRYCGLPKYEIFRNGQNHSLHIYNCTLEDAAIYQASASNSKGIVSCSGVLEVGEMNEFKIHQRYFAKLKQKTDNRNKELEGKENQEPLRTISPDRTQRKRRSTMEAFLSTPSSMEDEGPVESREVVAVEADARLQDLTVKEVEENPVTITNGAVSTVINGQAISENGQLASQTGTYKYDSAQKIFTAHQPKTPFIKKKIKISNSTNITKSDIPGEQTTEEKRAKDESSNCMALACTESLHSKGNSEEIMEVENTVSSAAVVVSGSRDVKECQKSESGELLFVERPSKNENVNVEVAVPSQKKQLPATSPPTSSAAPTVAGTGVKQAAKHEKVAGQKAKGEHLEMQNQIPHINLTKQQRSSVAASPRITKDDVSKTEDVSVMDIEEKSNQFTSASLGQRVSVVAACESRTALPQPPCGQAGDQLSERETIPCQKTVSVSQPALLREVTPAHTKMNRNDAPVILELPIKRCTMDVQPPQKVLSKYDTSADEIQTPSFRHGLHATIDKMTQDTRNHSRGSNESHKVPLTDLHRPTPLQIPGGTEKSRGCKVSPSARHSQVNTAIKTVKETEIQDRKKQEGKEIGRSLKLSDSGVSKEKLKRDIKSGPRQMVEQTETENTKNSAGKVKDDIIMDVSSKQTEKIKPTLETAEKDSSELQNMTLNIPDSFTPLQTHAPNNTNLSKLQKKDFQEIQKPVTKVISVAELLRSQLKALDATLANSVTTIPTHSDLKQDPTTNSPGTCEDLKDDDEKCKPEMKRSMPDRKTGMNEEDSPRRNIKETLMEVYHQLKTDQQQFQTQSATSPTIQALQKPVVIPSTSVIDTDTSAENPRPHDSAKNIDKGVGADPQEKETSVLASDIRTVWEEPGNQLTVPHMRLSAQESVDTVLQLTKGESVEDKDMALMKKTPETEPNSETKTLSDKSKTDEKYTKNMSTVSVQTFPSKNGENYLEHIQQDSPMVEEFSRMDSFASLTTKASPLLKKSFVSSIPSATAQELASGARRKILQQKAKPEEASGPTSPVDSQTKKKEVSTESTKLPASPVGHFSSPILSRQSPLLQPPSDQTFPAERSSPLSSRRKMSPETQMQSQQPSEESHMPKTEGKPANKDKNDPFKAPQVIRKIRGETFADASGHMKLWCQFFNILSDSTIKWYRNEEEIAQIKRNAGDESQVNLAVVQASSKDSGVYGCTITNEYGTDSTDCLLSADILSGMSLREDLGVGEEIEMTPMIFNRGVADPGVWGSKFFGRIMMQVSHIGDGCSHKVWRAKVIYGLEPVFESGNTCIIKVRNPIAYGGKGESCLVDRNLEIVTQECKIQNLAREYCKIFSAEARVIENFGPTLEVIPVYLMYRPGNAVPYAAVEADLMGVYQKYSVLDHTGRIDMRASSDVEQKCCALQHWIFQWTSGNMLLTRLEGVDTKITSVGISVKSTGHQGLSVEGNPKVFEHFVSQHQCNYFCGLLSLRSLKVMDSLLTTPRQKGSKSPLLQRKMASDSSSPQMGWKAADSPRLLKKTEQEDRKTPNKLKNC